MRRLKICFSFFLLFFALILLDSLWKKYKEVHILPSFYGKVPMVADSDLDTLYLYKMSGESFRPVFRSNGLWNNMFIISEFEQRNMVCVDSIDNIYRFGEVPPDYRLDTPPFFLLCFEPDNHDMAIRMGLFTDDLSTHDCLFYGSFERLFRVNRSTLLQNKGLDFLTRIETLFFSFFEEMGEDSYLKKSKKYAGEDEIEINEDACYSYLYHSSISGRDYLFEDLPLEERGWCLFYYPTLLKGSAPELMLSRLKTDESGSLYKIQERVWFNRLIYKRVDDSHYVRVVGSENTSINQPLVCSYFSDTGDANNLIGSYWKDLQ